MLIDNITPCESEADSTLAVEISERARQREIAAYLSAASFPPGMPSGPRETPAINLDPTLNALVQHGALRLDCDRSFLSLIDRQYQFIVAEMTRTHSLGEMKSAEGDTVYLGVSKLDLCFGVCPTTMKAFMDETGEWVRTGPNVIANKSRYIINDFRVDPVYMDKAFTTSYPHMVSYLEVPLVSPLGYLLGSYCVVDNRLRDYDNDETIGIMNDIASTIMAHLDLLRLKQNRHRSEQLIKGLGEFIGHESPAPGPLQTTHSVESTQTTLGIERANSLISPVDGINSGEPSAGGTVAAAALPEQAQSPQSHSKSSTAELDDSMFSPTRQELTPSTISPRLSEKDPCEQQENGREALVQRVPRLDSEPPAHCFTGSEDVKSTFSRAASTIRRAMNMDGLIFLDALPTTFASRSDQLAPNADEDKPGGPSGPFCSVIVQSSVDHRSDLPNPCQLPEAVLQRFIRRFPRGHVFSADEFGPIDSSFAPGMPFKMGCREHRESMRFRTDVSTLFRVLPQAKYVIFSPLWHFQRECWFAATLGWVTDQTQAIDVADINLLTAFGNSMVAEVSRFEALAISRKKSDFISSISHELRSPLHGILASSELLRDAIEDPLLLSIIDMIDSCGTTLLDTFNNILDHANINNSGHVSGDPNTNLQLVDLSELVEDVVEAVKVSHASEATFQLAINKGGDSANLHPSPELADNSMLVTLNIERGLKTAINVGAWKRIVTNVVGNALKYTSSGHIEVSLTRVQRTDAGELCDQVCFAVQDTGIGMSSDYLKYELFTPFSQDNSLSPGIGLGLSIVQQLVRGLRGTVEVTSSVGVGTCVKVLVPLDQGPHTPRPTIADTEHSDAVAILRGRTVCLVAVDAYTAQTSSVPNRVGETRTRSSAVEKTIRQIAGDALGMTISLATWDFPIPEADIYVLDAETLDGAESNLSTLKPLDLSPVFTLCSSPGSSQCLEQRALSPDAVHLHHSIGPTKLASVFSAALATKSAAGDQPLNPLPRASPAATEYSVIPIHSTSLHTYNKVPAVLEKPVQDVPLSEDLAENTRVAPHLQRSSPRYHVLIVDDNPINVKLLAAVVRKLDHTFATARNGLEAVQLYRNSLETQRPFDLVFMDISMPIMNGFEATREIRQLEEDLGAARCRVVVLTGLSSETTRRAAVVSGTDMFLTKPVKLEKVKRLLDTEFG